MYRGLRIPKPSKRQRPPRTPSPSVQYYAAFPAELTCLDCRLGLAAMGGGEEEPRASTNSFLIWAEARKGHMPQALVSLLG